MEQAQYAEEVGHYFKTSRSGPDSWIDKAKKQIEKMDGEIKAEAFGSTPDGEAYMLAFVLAGEKYKIVWPVLPSRNDDTLAARRQAATMLYHDVKNKTINAKVKGVEAAFFEYRMLPDGRTAAEVSAPELSDAFPKLLEGEVV